MIKETLFLKVNKVIQSMSYSNLCHNLMKNIKIKIKSLKNIKISGKYNKKKEMSL